MTYLVSPLAYSGQPSPPAPSTFEAFTLINKALVATADFLIFADENDSGKFKTRSKWGAVTDYGTDCGAAIQAALDASRTGTRRIEHRPIVGGLYQNLAKTAYI